MMTNNGVADWIGNKPSPQLADDARLVKLSRALDDVCILSSPLVRRAAYERAGFDSVAIEDDVEAIRRQNLRRAAFPARYGIVESE